ncbi:MAG: hypothetical protein WC865_12685 [Bacteroidales bacterium]
MKFTSPRKCKFEDCYKLIESGRSDIEYCSRECQEKARYRQNAEQEKRLNAIKSEIRKKNQILERLFRIWGSDPIPVAHMKKEGFQDGGYYQQVQHKKSGKLVRLFLYYGFFFNQEDQTIQIYQENELRID